MLDPLSDAPTCVDVNIGVQAGDAVTDGGDVDIVEMSREETV